MNSGCAIGSEKTKKENPFLGSEGCGFLEKKCPLQIDLLLVGLF